jgi:hypothetical protein
LLLVGHNVTVLAEIKRPHGPRGGGGGVLSIHQKDFVARCAQAGVHVYVWRSAAQAVNDLVRLRRGNILKALA